MYKYLMGDCKEDSARLFSVVSCDRTRGNGHKLKYRKFDLSIRKYRFIVRVVERYKRLPREVAECSFLELFKTQLDTVLGNQVTLL